MGPETPVAIFLALMAAGVTLGGMILGIPFYAIWTYHRRKMEELRIQQRTAVDQKTMEAIQELRREFAELRDTTSSYDVSFDTALLRIENRVSGMDQRLRTIEGERQAIQMERS